MKKILALLIVMSIIFSLAACGSSEQHNNSAAPPAHSNEQNETASDEPTVTIAYADEELLSSPDLFAEFIDYASEYQVKVVFSTNTAIKDFKFLKLSFADADEDGNMAFDIDEELYTADTLPPQRSLVVGMTFVGTVPDRGISYVDEDGAVKYYAIQMSGEDGSLLLTEFKK